MTEKAELRKFVKNLGDTELKLQTTYVRRIMWKLVGYMEHTSPSDVQQELQREVKRRKLKKVL
jgi:hypothetical protein